MYILDALIDFSKDNKLNKKIITPYAIQIIQRESFNDTLKSEENKELFKSILNKIFSCNLISENDKNKIKNINKNLNVSI